MDAVNRRTRYGRRGTPREGSYARNNSWNRVYISPLRSFFSSAESAYCFKRRRTSGWNSENSKSLSEDGTVRRASSGRHSNTIFNGPYLVSAFGGSAGWNRRDVPIRASSFDAWSGFRG